MKPIENYPKLKDLDKGISDIMNEGDYIDLGDNLKENNKINVPSNQNKPSKLIEYKQNKINNTNSFKRNVEKTKDKIKKINEVDEIKVSKPIINQNNEQENNVSVPITENINTNNNDDDLDDDLINQILQDDSKNENKKNNNNDKENNLNIVEEKKENNKVNKTIEGVDLDALLKD